MLLHAIRPDERGGVRVVATLGPGLIRGPKKYGMKNNVIICHNMNGDLGPNLVLE